MLTADATAETRRICREAGADAYLTKPLDARNFLDTVANLSVLRRQGAEPKTPTAVEDGESSIIDYGALSGISDVVDEPELVNELLETLLSDGERQLRLIRTAAKDNDYSSFRNAMHALKGSAADLGAAKLVVLCRKAESIKRYEFVGEREQLLAQIEDAFRLTYAKLREYFDRRMGGGKGLSETPDPGG
jgi:two-component system sensor histidine kinase RpfC